MLRALLGLTGLLLVSACASTPTGPADQILGTWTCNAASQGAVVDGKFTYMTGGKTQANAAMDVDAAGQKIWLAGIIDATWGFQPDGKLIETIVGLKVNAARVGGKDLPAPAVGAMVQPMVDQMIVGQSSTSAVVFGGATMTLTDDKGVVTTCKR
jgi:hypothetical protein